MKKILTLICLLSFLLISAKPEPAKLARLTIINKSGLPVEIKLTGTVIQNFYYLRIPTGDRVAPTEKVFTIARDKYRMQTYYIELWDPIYGYRCEGKSGTLYAYRNLRITYLECDSQRIRRGEPTFIFIPRFSWEFLF